MNTDNTLFEQERKRRELEIQNDGLDREIADLLNFCQVTEEQLSTYISTPSYFSDTQWETLQQEKKRIEDALKLKIACIPNPKKTKQNQEARQVQPHWLFVR